MRRLRSANASFVKKGLLSFLKETAPINITLLQHTSACFWTVKILHQNLNQLALQTLHLIQLSHCKTFWNTVFITQHKHKFLSIVEEYYKVQFSTQIRDTKYTTDGNLRQGDFFYVNVEVKNELGSGGAEPNIQSAYYYVEFVRSHSKIYPWSPLPCLHICLAGMYNA